MAAVDWKRIDAMTDEEVERAAASDPDAPDLSGVPAGALRIIHPDGGVSVRGIRLKLGLTQDAFAQRFGFKVSAVRDWEQGRKQPEAATRTLLLVIETDPELVAAVVARRAAA
ncbi:hypothetical protein TSO352_00100 [Azospirillum sp. TSO35-2]|nr:hypothetical protein TSO352_00100 [Azospirillum sp. TSO35-2]